MRGDDARRRSESLVSTESMELSSFRNSLVVVSDQGGWGWGGLKILRGDRAARARPSDLASGEEGKGRGKPHCGFARRRQPLRRAKTTVGLCLVATLHWISQHQNAALRARPPTASPRFARVATPARLQSLRDIPSTCAQATKIAEVGRPLCRFGISSTSKSIEPNIAFPGSRVTSPGRIAADGMHAFGQLPIGSWLGRPAAGDIGRMLTASSKLVLVSYLLPQRRLTLPVEEL